MKNWINRKKEMLRKQKKGKKRRRKSYEMEGRKEGRKEV